LTVTLSHLSYHYHFGFQSHGWSLAANEGYVRLARWQPGRDPNVPPAPAGGVDLAIDAGSRLAQSLRGVAQIVMLDESRRPLASASLAGFRQDTFCDEPLPAWAAAPVSPLRRSILRFILSPNDQQALARARERGPVLLAATSWRRLPPGRDRDALLFPTMCLDAGSARQVFCARQYNVSIWLIAAGLCGLAALLAGRSLHALLRAARRERHGLCLACGYDLRGSALRCPECSAPFPTGAESRRLRTLRWAFRVSQCACLALCLAGLVSSYFATTFRQGHTQIVLSGASVHLHQLSEAVRLPQLVWARLNLPVKYPVAPRLYMTPLRVSLPLWIPIVLLILTLYRFEIRPGSTRLDSRRFAGVHGPAARPAPR
jgi:hypothetical protein